ncbi:hypothetical protein C8R47DRAFT_1079091 [Mycena vitilis]|nr:hypothetical protein C8R47DRAFT_1079091 [Mycena vitilis]
MVLLPGIERRASARAKKKEFNWIQPIGNKPDGMVNSSVSERLMVLSIFPQNGRQVGKNLALPDTCHSKLINLNRGVQWVSNAGLRSRIKPSFLGPVRFGGFHQPQVNAAHALDTLDADRVQRLFRRFWNRIKLKSQRPMDLILLMPFPRLPSNDGLPEHNLSVQWVTNAAHVKLSVGRRELALFSTLSALPPSKLPMIIRVWPVILGLHKKARALAYLHLTYLLVVYDFHDMNLSYPLGNHYTSAVCGISGPHPVYFIRDVAQGFVRIRHLASRFSFKTTVRRCWLHTLKQAVTTASGLGRVGRRIRRPRTLADEAVRIWPSVRPCVLPGGSEVEVGHRGIGRSEARAVRVAEDQTGATSIPWPSNATAQNWQGRVRLEGRQRRRTRTQKGKRRTYGSPGSGSLILIELTGTREVKREAAEEAPDVGSSRFKLLMELFGMSEAIKGTMKEVAYGSSKSAWSESLMPVEVAGMRVGGASGWRWSIHNIYAQPWSQLSLGVEYVRESGDDDDDDDGEVKLAEAPAEEIVPGVELVSGGCAALRLNLKVESGTRDMEGLMVTDERLTLR